MEVFLIHPEIKLRSTGLNSNLILWQIFRKDKLEQLMSSNIVQDKNIIRDLGDGLVLRRSVRADAVALAEFNAKLHSDQGPEQPDQRLYDWVHDLASKPHPTFNEGDFTIVEDIKTGQIVSSLNLISQTWSYAGIPFGVGRPEVVATLPEYRNRGLVRAQFEVIHQWSAERGHLLQAITGIPYYYRLYGYEMTINLGGGRAGFTAHVPKLKEGESEPYQIRPAAESDIPFLQTVYDYGTRRSLVRCEWNEDLWRYEISGKSIQNVNRMVLHIIQTIEGEPLGFFAHPPFTWGTMLPSILYELKPGVSWDAVTPSIVRFLYNTGKNMLAEKPDEEIEAFGFWGGLEHPVYQVLKDRLPRIRKPYAWYIRVADLPGFLRLIAPILEQRLAESPLVGHTGELKITFYRSGLHLAFEKGHLTLVEEWRPEPVGHSGEAGFPGLTFLQLLFGYRTLEELMYAFPDCWVNNDTHRSLLEALFPRQASSVIPIS
jgi:hypothetical protein